MNDYKSCKARAKEVIKPQMGTLVLCFLIAYFAPMAVNAIPVIGQFASVFVLPILVLGSAIVYLNLIKGVAPDIKMLFEGFTKEHWLNVFLLNFMVGIYLLLWSCLFIIPGYIKGLSYSMATYIMAENRDIKYSDAINQSKAMMEGHKMELFKLQLSFIGWALLTIVTAGIAILYVSPYMNAAMAYFYQELKAKQGITPIIEG
ncbi:MAG: DUF975 family protein [Eubacteriales bacterium]